MDEAEYCDRIALIYRGELIAIGSPEELKTNFMQEEVLEVATDRPQDALVELDRLPGVKEVALFGKGLHVVGEAGEAERLAAAVRSHLEDHGFAVSRVEKIVPSLEDVFVSLIEARDRAGEVQKEVRV
jgi:ABC-2 type transport system ATP-binding protein